MINMQGDSAGEESKTAEACDTTSAAVDKQSEGRSIAGLLDEKLTGSDESYESDDDEISEIVAGIKEAVHSLASTVAEKAKIISDAEQHKALKEGTIAARDLVLEKCAAGIGAIEEKYNNTSSGEPIAYFFDLLKDSFANAKQVAVEKAKQAWEVDLFAQSVELVADKISEGTELKPKCQ